MKKMISTLILVSILLSANTMTYAKNDETSTTGFVKKGELIAFLNENGVSKKDQKILVEKNKNNVLWDVYNPEKLKNIPDEFYCFDPQTDENLRYFRFSDGSFIKIENTLNDSIVIDGTKKNNKLLKEKIADEDLYYKIISKNPNISEEKTEVSTLGVVSGTGYAYYYDYKVSLTSGTMYASMITEFVLVNGAEDYLISSGFYNPIARGFGELGQMPEIEIVRDREDIGLSRWALANTNWYVNYPISTPWGGSTVSGTYYLWLGVGDNHFIVSNTLPY